ncbi:DUF4214 domain-containing protein [Paracidovorax citrulli]
MAAADYYSQIQQAYIAYYGRPADPDGLEYWAGELDKAGGDLAVIIDAFGNSEESQELYGADTPAAQVNKIYQTLFGRPADMEGLQYYVNGLRTGEFSLASVALDVYNGARNEDKTALEAKLTYAQAFTNAIDTVQELLGYAGKAAAEGARGVLADVKDQDSLEAALETVDQAVGGVVDSGNAGQTVNLTKGLDTVVGTDANDVINARGFNAETGAAQSTLTAYDSIDGGKGDDTLNIYASRDASLPANYNAQLPATVTIRNVETINLYNQGATATDPAAGVEFTTDGAVVDASRFVGATAINQYASAADVVNLGAGQTAGFVNITPDSSIGTNNALANVVTAAKGVTTANVRFDNVVSKAGEGYVGYLDVKGDALSTVNLTGKLTVSSTAPAGTVGNIAIEAFVGKDVQTLTFNSTVNAEIDFREDATSSKHVTTVDASGSTGAITYNDTETTVANVKTGSGNDRATLVTQLTTTNKTASLATGAGNDVLVVNVSGAPDAGNTATVDAGAGDDDITLVTLSSLVNYNVSAGDGDDRVVLGNGVLKTSDVIDGGAGTDTIGLYGKDVYTNADYVMLTKQVKNFEAIEFIGSDAAGSEEDQFDAAQLSAYKTITFSEEGGGGVKNVAADQTIVIQGAAAIAIAAGSVFDFEEPQEVVYGGSLNMVASGGTPGDATVVGAVAKDLALTINAGNAGAAVDLKGFVQTATITLNNGVDNATKPLADTIAHVEVGPDSTMLKDLTALTLKGTGSAGVFNATSSNLVTIDASQLGGKFTVGSHAGDAMEGLMYRSMNVKAETIKLGDGLDFIQLASSEVGELSAKTYDTVEGLHFVFNEAGDQLDLAKSDVLTLSGVSGPIVKFETTQTDFDLALQEVANASAPDLAFQFGGDTWIYVDSGPIGYDAKDALVKLVGVNVDDAIIAMNSMLN